MTTCSESQYRDFGRDADHYLRRARVAGYVLLVGLLLEVVSCIIWFHGIETLASIACVALVAGGVAGEIFFEGRSVQIGSPLGFSSRATAIRAPM